MRRKAILIGAVFLAACVTAQAQRPGLNAFLNKRAETHAALMKQVQNDQVVMDRYMRHFGMSPKQVLGYFSELRRFSLDKPLVTTVYNVPESGVIRARTLKFRKGTAVWVDLAGKPILKVSCGNPLTKGPNDPESDNPIAQNMDAPEEDLKELLPELGEPELIAEQPFDVPQLEEPNLPVMDNRPVVLNQTPTAGASGVPVIPTVTAIPIGGFAPLLAVIGGITAGFSTGGGSIQRIVPEPATLFALAAGAALVMRRRKK